MGQASFVCILSLQNVSKSIWFRKLLKTFMFSFKSKVRFRTILTRTAKWVVQKPGAGVPIIVKFVGILPGAHSKSTLNVLVVDPVTKHFGPLFCHHTDTRVWSLWVKQTPL